MTTVVACPECQQNLQVPPEQLGQSVRCPGCACVFTAGAAATAVRAAAAPPPVPTDHVPAWEKRPEDDLAEPLDEDEASELEGEEPRKRRKKGGKKSSSGGGLYEELTRRQRKMLNPHRGTLILIYGILSLMCSMGLLGVYFGALAWQWGNNDIQEMYAGRMDPSGRALTQTGRILGIVGLCMVVASVLVGLTCGTGGVIVTLRR